MIGCGHPHVSAQSISLLSDMSQPGGLCGALVEEARLLLPQLTFEQFSARVLGQGLGKHYFFRYLECRQMLPTVP
jgi:hypothetical protein